MYYIFNNYLPHSAVLYDTRVTSVIPSLRCKFPVIYLPVPAVIVWYEGCANNKLSYWTCLSQCFSVKDEISDYHFLKMFTNMLICILSVTRQTKFTLKWIGSTYLCQRQDVAFYEAKLLWRDTHILEFVVKEHLIPKYVLWSFTVWNQCVYWLPVMRSLGILRQF